jgi:hypothetical protein
MRHPNFSRIIERTALDRIAISEAGSALKGAPPRDALTSLFPTARTSHRTRPLDCEINFRTIGAGSGKGAGIVSSSTLGREPTESRSAAVQWHSGNPFSP